MVSLLLALSTSCVDAPARLSETTLYEDIATKSVSPRARPFTPRFVLWSDGAEKSRWILLPEGEVIDTADTQMPWDGGCVANVGGACNRGRVISAEATRDRWLQTNGLSQATPVESVVEVSTDDGGPAHRFDFVGAAPVQWWRLDGAGHTVPSQTVRINANAVTGIQNHDVEFAEIVWAFFAATLAR